MPAVVNHQPVVYGDRFKPLLFPLLVPVAVLGLSDRVADADVRHRQLLQHAVQRLLVEKCLLDVARQPVVGVLKCFKTGLSGYCCQQVTSIAVERFYAEFYLEILHNDVKFAAKLQKIGKNLSWFRVFP